eukprot:Gregarina_sp_Poly_1__313@NODE_1077_length_5170_cov_692_612581_g748_i0_p2_GENE_NODE_1077_length_5170_cov_692_612581_g748_i0NODE_1077_length_5170_cov_692_612581_g748_i0_p2_ORF_typecomplete_len500_score71_74Tau95/PF09734_9/3e32Tau95_N/PF17682_1/1_7e09_NODE_1077_length_5170_cov_692_612581_g748_i036505149
MLQGENSAPESEWVDCGSPINLAFKPSARGDEGVRSQRLCSVQVPGQVKGDGSSVVTALGGYGKIADSFADPNGVPLILSLSPSDPYSKFIAARASKRAGVLLRFRRWKSGRQQVRLEGVVEYTFSFQALADYYLAPPRLLRFPVDFIGRLEILKQVPRLREALATKILSGCGVTLEPECSPLPNEAEEILSQLETRDERSELDEFITPSVYTRQVTPFNYAYRDNVCVASAKYFVVADSQTEEDVFNTETLLRTSGTEDPTTALACIGSTPFVPMARGIAGPINVIARFHDSALPTANDGIAQSAISDQTLAEEVDSLFAKRPVWQRVALMAALCQRTTVWKLKPILATKCFLFLDGPWRGCLVRYGYDPRKDLEAMKYQCIDFRDPHFRSVRWKTQVSSTFVADNMGSDSHSGTRKEREPLVHGNHDYQFLQAPTRPSQFYQLCDIEDSVIKRMLTILKPTETCTKSSGWLTAEQLGRIRDVLCNRARLLRSGGTNL